MPTITKTLDAKDFELIAKIHLESLPNSFLSQLGQTFLALFYKKISNSSVSVLFALKDGDTIVGFIAGSAHMTTLKKELLHSWFAFTIAILPDLFRYATLKGLLELLVKKRPKKVNLPKAELISMAISKDHRNRRLGKILFEELSNFFEKKNIHSFSIMVGDSLEDSIRFYERLGAVQVGNYHLHGNQSSRLYICRVKE